MELKELLLRLSDDVNIGGINEAINTVGKELSGICRIMNYNDGNLIAYFDKGKEETILLDAHIDQIGMVVTSVEDNGFIKVSAAGGLDNRMLEGTPVKVHGKHKLVGVFCSTPPHLSGEKDAEPKKIEELYIDLGMENLKELVSLGDKVTFKQTAKVLKNNRITGAAFDNRAGVAALVETAKLIKDLPCKYNVAMLFSDQEELGLRGAKLKAFGVFPNKAIVVDVNFGDSPDVPKEKSTELGSGAEISVSPVLSNEITKELISVAKSNDIKFSVFAVGGNTSTNADEISVVRTGIPTALVSIPLRNMHTPVEIIDILDVKAVAELLAAFVKE